MKDAEKADTGKKAEEATNPIEAAIGENDADGNEAAFGAMNKDAQIAAAITLRGMAKGGKFALKSGVNDSEKALKSTVESAVDYKKGTDENEEIGKVLKAANKSTGAEVESVKGIAQGIKGIVDAAKSGGVELKDTAAGDTSNADAGKLFLVKNDAANNNGGEAADAEKAAAAVSKVSGEAILSAIVKDAEKAAAAVSKVSGEAILSAIVKDAEKAAAATGKKADVATNPIEAAIGANDAGNEAAFGGSMNKDAQIAAAITLRGMAKGGKFALKNNVNDSEKALKSTVESAVDYKRD